MWKTQTSRLVVAGLALSLGPALMAQESATPTSPVITPLRDQQDERGGPPWELLGLLGVFGLVALIRTRPSDDR